VLVETVGVGQSETVVRAMVDFFLLLMLPGAGDELQGMKRGIMELTDLIAINKADGNDRTKAQIARREYENALHLLPASPTGWSPRVVTCSARAREGISEVWTIVVEHNLWLRQHGLLEAVRRDQVRRWMDEMIRAELLRRFRSDPLVRERWPDIEREVVEGRLSSFRAVEQLLDSYYKAK
jgi:LAO/AO transport system kinase